MKIYRLPKRTCILWQIRLVIIYLVITGAAYRFVPPFNWFNHILYLWSVIALLFILIYVPFYFKKYQISFPEGSIIIERGIFIKTTHIMPFSRLVYVQSYSTPIAKIMKLGGLSFKAARIRIFIPEIESKDVNYIIDALTAEAENEKRV